MTKSQDLREYRRVITAIVGTGPIDISASDDVYDRYLTDFLRRIKTTASPEKLKWMLLRVGLRTEINAMHSHVRAALKAEHDDRKVEQNKARGAEQRQSKNWKKDYCEKHGITLDQFSEHFQASCRAGFAEKLDEVVSDRAARILSSWLCDGVPLAKVSGHTLDNLITKEDAVSQGHAANAAFYRGLREHTPDHRTVGDSVVADDLVRIFNRSFKNNIFAWEENA